MCARWLGVGALVGLLLSVAPSAVASEAARRAAVVGYQRDRLAIHDVGRSWYVVTDGYGRVLSAQQFARALGDVRTYEVASDVVRLHGTVGGVAASLGPVAMLVGLNRIAIGEVRDSEVMVGAGYGTIVLGMVATAGGIALMADRRSRRPPSYYDRAQARRLIGAYNRRLLDAYGLSTEDAALLPRVPRKPRAKASIGLAGVWIDGTF